LPVPRLRETIETPQGPLSVYAQCPSGSFAHLEMDSGLGNFEDYSSIIQKRDEFEKIVASKDGRVTLVLLGQTIIVGYFACWHPRSGERWSKLGELMYELGAIEVSRNFRKLGIARHLVNAVLTEPFIEDKIAYMNGYSWTWDVEDSEAMLAEYRTVHLKILEPYCFREFYTNEPNIRLRNENIFMARIGARVSPADQERFKNLRLGMLT
jgi:acetoin utilization protein AcuA